MNPSKMIVAIAAGVALTACGQSGAGKSAGPVSVSAVASPSSGSSSGSSSSSGSTSESSSGSASTSPGPGAAPTAPVATSLPPGVVLTGLSVAVRELELAGGVCATTAVADPVARSSAGARDGSHDPSHVGSRDAAHDPSQVGSRDGAHDPSHVGSCEGSERSDDASRDDSHGGSRDGEHRECEAELGPFVARLDPAALGSLTAGSLSQIWAATVPAGSYSKLEAKLCGIDPAKLKDPAQAALAKAMNGASVVLEGTYQAPGSEGAPVPFRIAVNACAELERRVNVTVDASGTVSNLTLSLPVGAWFRDAKGNALAPDTAAGAAAIAANVAGSLDLYGDDDHDGREDDEKRSGK